MSCCLVTKPAPDFTATAVMPDNSFDAKFSVSSLRGKKVVLFFYPLDFTFVCPSEIIAFDKALAEFKARGTEVVGVSVDSHFTHLAWKNTPREQGGIGQVQYPLVADLTKEIARSYGVLINEAVALRGLFLIDRLASSAMPWSTTSRGQRVAEAVRLVDAPVPRAARRSLPGQLEEGDEAMKPTAAGAATSKAR
jgi:peroxiredoxin (alkyl hydroperoxide reductase subunit C)